MRFKGLDINLLIAFDALVETRSVARASKRLNLSQSATSAALARLREYFKDELLIASGNRMHPTEAAYALTPSIRACLDAALALVSTSTAFDPAASDRVFKVAASDSLITSLFAPLSKKLQGAAPRVQIQFYPPNGTASEMLDRGDIDLLILPIDFIRSKHPTKILFEEAYVIAGDRNHPIFKDTMTEEAVFAYPHVSIGFSSPLEPSFGDMHLDRRRKSRRVDVWLSSFAAAPMLLLGTTRLAVMHERLARKLSEVLPIEHRPAPFPFPPHKQVVQYHEAQEHDRGLQWLMGEIEAELKS